MEPKQQQSREPETGGREFGLGIEPMQARTASGNEGLTDKSSAKPKQNEGKREKKKREKKRRRAA
jgi:hypothetical protein